MKKSIVDIIAEKILSMPSQQVQKTKPPEYLPSYFADRLLAKIKNLSK